MLFFVMLRATFLKEFARNVSRVVSRISDLDATLSVCNGHLNLWSKNIRNPKIARIFVELDKT